MIPSVGRIVHYVMPEGHNNKGAHRAAQISGVYHDTEGKVSDESPVALRVTLLPHEAAGQAFGGPAGFIDAEHVFQDHTGTKPGSWHECEHVSKETSKKEARA
jgi:hypothetical protein